MCTLIRPLHNSTTSYFDGVLPKCYARSVNLANTLIFEIGTSFINIGNLVMLLCIIYLVRLRYTSVARKEMVFFFISLVIHTITSLVIDTGVSPPGSRTYAYFVSFEMANISVVCWSLLFAGLSSFNFWDDGSFKTMMCLYISSSFVFIVNYMIAIFTFKGWSSGLNNTNTSILFIFYFILNPLMLGIWLISQIIICCFSLVFNWWAIGALSLTCFFFAASQVLLYAFSEQICLGLKHYVDGTLFSSLSMMFCYMMIFKYWDIITFDDDEYYRYTEVVPAVANKNEARSLLQN
ncbi:Chitin synthase, class 7 [Pichia californica]|uniref:Chitin synthase export chaperone n=1 Tax=Pichia californica TaxID=460514 RepID=A0A9P6WL77_9ASCO|nr:Chitin synthase, class 7 [[Candida] californica]KAG0689095.1 Chitin synthase, class 7 [[Candida] californica]